MNQIIEIRSYNLKAGTRTRFHRIVTEQSMPLLKQWGIDVVAYGPSLHDENSYFLIRAYLSLQERQQSQNEFYSSSEWRLGPRQSIIECIESDTSVVFELDSTTIASIRKDTV